MGLPLTAFRKSSLATAEGMAERAYESGTARNRRRPKNLRKKIEEYMYDPTYWRPGGGRKNG